MKKRFVVGLSITAVAVLIGSAANGASAAEPTIAVTGSKPAWIGSAKHLGAASSSQKTEFRVYLAPKGGFDALERAAVAVSTAGSRTYGRFLTEAQFQSAYAPTASVVTDVETYLRTEGLTVAAVGRDNRYLTVHGTIGRVNAALHTTIARYRRSGRSVQAPSTALRLPSEIAGAVLSIAGLDTSPAKAEPASLTPAPAPGAVYKTPYCSTYFGQHLATRVDGSPLPRLDGKSLVQSVCGYVGRQLRSAYEGDSTLTGAGVSVAVLSAYTSPTLAADVQHYAIKNGDGAYAPGQFRMSTAPRYTDLDSCGASGWYPEEHMDVEAVHAMAPGARIHYYGVASCEPRDFTDGLAQIVDDDDVQIVNNSWAGFESDEWSADIEADECSFLQGALEGISFVASSGDHGDAVAASGMRQAEFPSSDPFMTAVGGTTDAIGENGKLTAQTGWGNDEYALTASGDAWTNEGFDGGATGGASTLFTKPAFQSSLPGSRRLVPDVAMDADPGTPFLTGLTETFSNGTRYGEFGYAGTSLSSPLFAGMTALAIESAGHGVGLLNPTIYGSARAAFTDVTGPLSVPGTVDTYYLNRKDASGGYGYLLYSFDRDSSLTVHRGWDDVTGLGSPNTRWLSALR